jgi:hypothetical protein
MPQVPRIRRAQPGATPFQPPRPLPVEVTMIWHDGRPEDYDALAVAWTPAKSKSNGPPPGETPDATGSLPVRYGGASSRLSRRPRQPGGDG